MKASVGDRLVLESTHGDSHRRVGVITGLRHDDGSPPYLVRWLDDGHEALVFPGPDSRVEPGHLDGQHSQSDGQRSQSGGRPPGRN